MNLSKLFPCSFSKDTSRIRLLPLLVESFERRYRRFIIRISFEFVKELMKTKRKLGQENVIVRAEPKKDRSIRIKKLAKKSGILGE